MLTTLTIEDPLIQALSVRLSARSLFLSSFMSNNYQSQNGRSLWFDQLDRMRAIRLSHTLARPIEKAFNPNLQKLLPNTTPPRPAMKLTWDETMDDYDRFYREMEDIKTISGHLELNPRPEALYVRRLN